MPRFLTRYFGRRAQRSPRRERRASWRPLLEQLEVRLTPSNNGTVHLTDSTATIVEETHYADKKDVYAYGNDLITATTNSGFYDVEVVVPGAKSGDKPLAILGISDYNSPVQVVDGHFTGYVINGDNDPSDIVPISGDASPGFATGPRGLAISVWDVVVSTGNTNMNPPAGSQGYDDTSNPGGEYQVVLAQHDFTAGQDNFSQFTGNNSVTKSKNFKVESPAPSGFVINTSYTLYYPDGTTDTGDSENPAAPAPLGTEAQDSATVLDSGNNIVTTGTITFYFYGPDGEIGLPDVVNVDPSGLTLDPTVEGPLGAGDYYFTATYTPNGTDTFNSDPEPFTILPGTIGAASTTTLHTAIDTMYSFNGTITSASANDVIPLNSILAYGASGASMYDTVEVDGVPGVPVGGTVTFTLYKSGNPYGTPDTEPLATIDATVSSSGAASVTFSDLGPGSYYFIAHYNGDDPSYPLGKDIGPEPFSVNTPPTAGGVDLGCIAQGSSATTTEAALLSASSDSDGDTLTFAGVSNPLPTTPAPGASVTDSSGNITYTPPASFWGETGASFQYTVSDGLDSATGTVTVEVDATLTAGNASASTAMNVAKTVTATVNDADGSEPLHVSGINYSGTGTVVLNSPTGMFHTSGGTATVSFTYTPGPDFHGSDSFTYTVTDDDGCVTSTGTITISVTSGARTQGYWKTHETSTSSGGYWTLDNGHKLTSLSLGGATYTPNQVVAIMNMSAGTGTSANAILILFDQLVAAKINVLNGVTPDAADSAAISDADAAIIAAAGTHGSKLSGNKKGQLVWGDATQAYVQVSSTLGQEMVFDASVLTAFNQTGT